MPGKKARREDIEIFLRVPGGFVASYNFHPGGFSQERDSPVAKTEYSIYNGNKAE